jgi:hypothetical protein
MKIYVTGFEIRPEHKDAQETGKPLPPGAYNIYYHIEPHWKFSYREAAEFELNKLQNEMRIHKGDHYCTLSVEEIEPETFAIACNDHPPLTGAR